MSDNKSYTCFALARRAVKRRGYIGDRTNALMFLVSEESGFVTGQKLNVDGGWVVN